MRTIPLPSGRPIPVLGQGTWHMGDQPAQHAREVAALRYGIDLGMTLIDTAEMYGDGGAERVVGEAIAGRRDAVFVVSKVYPWNATTRGTIAACERSLKRLGTDYLDLYLLHWREKVPLGETLAALRRLKEDGKIRDTGVSNFRVRDMEEALSVAGGGDIVTNQVAYNLMRRRIESDLLPWCREHGIPIMAYSPLEQTRRGLLTHPTLVAVAARHNATPGQLALAWVLRMPNVVAIPKAVKEEHLKANRAALELQLTDEDLAELDRAFPAERLR